MAVAALALPIAVWQGISKESFWDGAVILFWSSALGGIVAYIYDQICKPKFRLFGDKYVYRCILTNDWERTELDIIIIYN